MKKLTLDHLMIVLWITGSGLLLIHPAISAFLFLPLVVAYAAQCRQRLENNK